MRIKYFLVAFLSVTLIELATSYPPPQPVQASQTKTTQNKPLKGTQKKKVVKDATKKKKTVKQAQIQPQRVSRSIPKPPTGTCADWIKSAGIVDVVSANELIRRESNCNPSAVNPSSGACGVAQELPCGKSGCKLGDGACQVKWMSSYVAQRYGSWSAAVAFHNANSWY